MALTINELLETKLDGVIRPHKGSVKIDETGTGKADPAYTLNIKVDYSGMTVREVLDNLATPNAWISRQRALRTMKKVEIEEMQKTTPTVKITDMGKRPRTQVDVKAAFMADFASATPEEQAKMIADLQAKMEQGQ